MTVSYVDLKGLCNASLDTAIVPRQSGWAGFPIAAKRLDGLPCGEGVFDRVPFRVAGPAGKMMVLMDPQEPAALTIPVNAAFAALYLLHAMDKGDIGRKPVAYTLNYEGGGSAEVALQVGESVSDWIFPREAANCRVGWTGFHKDNEYQKCLFVTELVNPHPGRKVASISLRRLERYGTYILVAMTRSTAAPFFRKAARGGDEALCDYIELTGGDVLTADRSTLKVSAVVRTPNGKPVPGASVTAVIGARKFAMSRDGEAWSVSIPRQKGWRKYANAVRIDARRGGKTLVSKGAVFYASGRPRLLTPPRGKRPPQFIIIAFDDCKGLQGLEAMLAIMEKVKAGGSSAPITMYTAPCPPRAVDLDKQIILYQRMYDLGCEFANHTLNHNPGGVNWFALPHAGQVQEIDGCRRWFRENIFGLWHVYSQKSGGGGAKGFRDPKFSRELMRSQKFEYNANNVTAQYATSIPHPDVQFWPYKLADEWAIDIGLVDGDAPPVHRPITKGFYTDYSGKFDYEVKDGVEMMVANLAYRYQSPHRPPMVINAFHEWGMGSYYPSHRHERAILEGFLMEVLVKHRRKYPGTYVITFHQLIEYTKSGDLDHVLKMKSGQGRG